MKLIWAERAARDLEAIESYTADDNPQAAIELVEKLINGALALREHPRLGRVVVEVANPDVRELVIGNYRLVYRIQGKTVEILQVFEGHRLLQSP